MRLCYALRRGVFYPSQDETFGQMPPRELRPTYLAKVRQLGFDGVEVPAGGAHGVTEAGARELGRELTDAGMPAVAVRGGGPIAHPREGASARHRTEEAIRFAGWIGAAVVNLTVTTPPTDPRGIGEGHEGERVSQGSSRLASEADFVATADRFRPLARLAADLGLSVSIEVHQGSIADNSWSALHLLDLIGETNVGLNPDLGNIYRQFDTPEESNEAAIVAMAARSNYWHCKNVKRLYIPELKRSFFQRVALPDGDIDYRFAIKAMVAAGYQGYLAIEGKREGDQLYQDGIGATYVREILADLA